MVDKKTDEERLRQKLESIERLFAGATTPGERIAAGVALKKIKKRLQEIQKNDRPIEYKFTMNDMWSRKLLVALMRRYGISPYRYYRQRYTTVMARVPKQFVEEILWPEFTELNEVLRAYLDETTNRIISKNIFSDSSEAVVVRELG
ncbi:MAG: hypothetical protein H6696_07775 [Deferribacteres bacterium]|nr:hypothetical protein [candidate division KSB1 bacterium]MCB9501824.1 hypothetical protein [Deferribacteres bacterium]